MPAAICREVAQLAQVAGRQAFNACSSSRDSWRFLADARLQYSCARQISLAGQSIGKRRVETVVLASVRISDPSQLPSCVDDTGRGRPIEPPALIQASDIGILIRSCMATLYAISLPCLFMNL